MCHPSIGGPCPRQFMECESFSAMQAAGTVKMMPAMSSVTCRVTLDIPSGMMRRSTSARGWTIDMNDGLQDAINLMS